MHAAVSAGAAACSLCLQLWQCFAPQAAEVSTIMALALAALPGPAGWTHTGFNRVDDRLPLLEPHLPVNHCRQAKVQSGVLKLLP